MGGSIEIKVVCFLLIAAVAAAPHAEAAISCSQVLSSASACLGYLRGGGAVTLPCCNGFRSLYSAAATKPDRQAVCGCVKTIAASVGAKPEFINSLAGKCGIAFPYRYSPSMDCSKVQLWNF